MSSRIQAHSLSDFFRSPHVNALPPFPSLKVSRQYTHVQVPQMGLISSLLSVDPIDAAKGLAPQLPSASLVKNRTPTHFQGTSSPATECFVFRRGFSKVNRLVLAGMGRYGPVSRELSLHAVHVHVARSHCTAYIRFAVDVDVTADWPEEPGSCARDIFILVE